MTKNAAFDKKLAWLGLAAGLALIVQSYEAVNSTALSFLADISIALWALYAIWVFILSIQLFRKKDDTTPQPVPWAVWLLGDAAWHAIMPFRIGYPTQASLPSPRRALNQVTR